MNATRVILFAATALFLSGCVTQAHYDGQTFNSIPEAYSYQLSKYSEAIAAIEPLPEPILENGAYVILDRFTIDSFNRQVRPNIQILELDYLFTLAENDYRNVHQALIKKNIFRNLEIIASNGSKPDLLDYDGVIYHYAPNPSTQGYFFMSPYVDDKPIPISRGYDTWVERLENWFEEIEQLAQVGQPGS